MHEYEYVSSLSSYIQDFLHEKRALGYKYRTEEYVLRRFDSYWYGSGNPESINQENLAGWLQQSPTEGKSRLSQRICTVRLLILFMKGLGINSCVPYEKIRRAKPAVHIMSSDEIISLFNVMDAYFPSRETRDTARMAREYGVLFRLILTTGMRRTEAASIRINDIDIERKNINIYDAKGNKDRIVYMAEDMAALLKQYLGSMDPTISTENRWLFPGVNPDNHISSGALAIKFNEFWNVNFG